MGMDKCNDLMQALVAKLYSILTGNDNSIKVPRNKFVSWFGPGVPFEPEDFRFCAKGFTGTTAEEVSESYHKAFVLSKMFDFVPGVSEEVIDSGMQQMMYAGDQDTISSVYRDVLNYSKVVHNELSEKEKKKLQKFRDLLTVTMEEEDIITGKKETVTRPGKLTIAYTDRMKDYLEAADEFMNMKIDALSASGKDAESKRRVYNWANKEKYLRKNLEAAEMAWVAQGYKNEYEQINAYIDHVTRKSLILYKKDLISKLEGSKLTSPSDGEFYYTTLLPGSFATSTGWTRFSFYEHDYEMHYKKDWSKWGGGGGLNLGFFSIGASAGGSRTEISKNQKAENFGACFEFAQIPICRPWFEPGFFSMRSWKLDKTWDLTYDKNVSDGAAKPNGRLIAYPVSALFARRVRLTSSSWASHYDYLKKTVHGGGSVGWGPFSIGGSYSKGSTRVNKNFHMEGETLCVDGMQLIGFINNIIPKAPNPHPDLTDGDFVGGK